MLERLQAELAKDRETLVHLMLHGPTVQVTRKAVLLAVDQVGVVAQIKGTFGGVGEERMFPWSAISGVQIIP